MQLDKWSVLFFYIYALGPSLKWRLELLSGRKFSVSCAADFLPFLKSLHMNKYVIFTDLFSVNLKDEKPFWARLGLYDGASANQNQDAEGKGWFCWPYEGRALSWNKIIPFKSLPWLLNLIVSYRNRNRITVITVVFTCFCFTLSDVKLTLFNFEIFLVHWRGNPTSPLFITERGLFLMLSIYFKNTLHAASVLYRFHLVTNMSLTAFLPWYIQRVENSF